ncbi:monooxygenase [Celeribacter indicus]|uniref:Monooxygenase n=2 Tax=Celeribacter indicus TaxID=1208324 RepID=A0A0B5E136_9RHOB|nr:monooxygenase [Celeribacter indicus]
MYIAWHGRNGAASEGWNHPAWGRGRLWNRAETYQEIALLLERARLDMIVFSDRVDIAGDDPAGAVGRMDTLAVCATIADATQSIGIVPAVSTELYRPFMVARLISTLDHLSSGRIGWSVQPMLSDAAVTAVGQVLPIPEAAEDRMRRAAEFVDICRKLWDSWDEDAVVGDPETAIFADPGKVHEIDHEGEFYSSRGPLNTVRPPQGQPVTVMAPADEAERRFAAQEADVVILPGLSVEALAADCAALRAEIAAAGRTGRVKILVSVNPVVAASEGGARIAAAQLDEAYGALALGGMRIIGDSSQVCTAVKALVADTGADGISIDAVWLPSYVIQLMSYLVTPLQREGLFPATYGAGLFKDQLASA